MSPTTDRAEQLPAVAVEPSVPRRLAAFVHADVAGYSRLVGLDDAGTGAVLADIRRTLIDPALSRFGGRVVNGAGDSLLMEFGSVIAAVRCAAELQGGMPDFDDGRPPERCIRYRMGVNVGDAITEGGNLHGDGVNIAARLQAICPPGVLCVSRVVHDEVRGRLGLAFEALGALELKNIARPVEAFVLRIDPGAGEGRPPRRLPRALSHRPAVFAVLAGLLLIGGLVAAWEWRARHSTSAVAVSLNDGPGTAPPLSIAVLPFDNMSSDPEQGYLADGISDDLTTDLSHLHGAFVIARESAFSFKGRETDVRKVGQQLGVRYVLEGSVRKLGEAVRINAQLVSADSGAHIWAERFDEPIRDLGAGQDAIVSRIGTALGTQLVKPASARPAATAPGNPAAYDLVLRARAVLNEPPTEIRNTIAAGLFEQALRLDPHSVPAMAGAALMLMQLHGTYFIKRASGLVADAERIAPGSPDMLTAKFVLQREIGRTGEAVTTLQKLLEVDTSAAGLAAQLAPFGFWGLPDIPIPLVERILQLNPRSPANSLLSVQLGRDLIQVGRSAEAIGVLERVLALEPQGGIAAKNKGAPLSLGQSSLSSDQANWALLYLASAYALSDRLDDARRTLALALRSTTLMEVTVRSLLSGVRSFDDPALIPQERRIADGLRRAGLRDHLDEDADSHIPSDGALHPFENTYGPTPMTVPGGTTVRTAEVERLLAERKPLVLTTASANPSLPGAIFIQISQTYFSGSFDDVWQAQLKRMMQGLTGGELQKPIIVFAFDINRWNSRNLALRLIALGYTQVYWYRGGWEAWDAHDLPKAPVVLQLR